MVLEHHGVKGMKWGVRKDAGHEGESAKTKKIAKLDKQFERDAGGVNLFAVNRHAISAMNNHTLPKINNKPAYKDVDLKKNPVVREKYEKEVTKAYITHLQEAANFLGTNASGTKKYTIEHDSDGNWKLSTADVQHDDATSVTLIVKRDSNGMVTSVELPDDSMAQGEDLVTNVLAHHGVKGMKWGVSRKTSSSGPPKVSQDHIVAKNHQQTVKEHGVKALSNEDLRKLNERMQLEQNHRDLSGKAPTGFNNGHNHVKKVLSVAKTLNDIHNTVNGPVGKAVKAAVKAKKG